MRHLIIAFALIATGLAVSCDQAPKREIYRKSGEAMHTNITITVVSDDAARAERAIDAAFDEIVRLEKLLSFWSEDSEVAAINRMAGREPVKVSHDTLEIINWAGRISNDTDGAFDATIGPVIRQWDFKKHLKPDPAKLANALKRINHRMMIVNTADSTAYLADASMSFDTGGIAKGFGADKAVETLKRMGINAGLVAIAGDIRAFGRKPDGSGWTVGIRDPRGDGPEALMAMIELTDSAISTSGDYERYFMDGNKRLHHLLDPRTGYPAEGAMSASVVAPLAVQADGYSTGIFILGPEAGLRAIDKAGLDCLIMDSEGKPHMTSRIRPMLKWAEGSRYAPRQ